MKSGTISSKYLLPNPLNPTGRWDVPYLLLLQEITTGNATEEGLELFKDACFKSNYTNQNPGWSAFLKNLYLSETLPKAANSIATELGYELNIANDWCLSAAKLLFKQRFTANNLAIQNLLKENSKLASL